jgi:23S rRNA pseudouridine1911/1915/1917 synthase
MSDVIEKRTFRVEPGEAGERLDAFLARRAGDLSRSRVKALIRAGEVSVAGLATDDPNTRLKADSEVVVGLPAPRDPVPRAESIPLAILHEDADLIVIDKPPGLVVHPGAGIHSGTLVNALIAHCGDGLSGIGGVRRPGIVHRLDKDTSGILVVAKNDFTHRGLSEQFADHGREGPLLREYEALAWGVPKPHIGSIEAPITRDPKSRVKQAVARSSGRHALTHYAVAERFGARASLLTCRLETGRTHQIRVHLAHIGHPLVGDHVYGAGFTTKANTLPADLRAAVEAFGRQALHARRLRFRHPRSGEILTFETDPPTDLMNLIELFRKRVV